MPTVTLTTRFGDCCEQPSDLDLETALQEVYVENHPSLTDADYLEHPNTWLMFGDLCGEKWTVYTLDVYRNGTVIYSKLDDQDDDAPEFERTLDGVNFEQALKLWRLLNGGQMEKLLLEPWHE